MKGIQKLFLGLFLVALVSVGFKVEVKAAATKPVITHTVSDGNLSFSFTADKPGAFPEVDTTSTATKTGTFKYECTVHATDVEHSSTLKKVTVELTTTFTPASGTTPSSTSYACRYWIDSGSPVNVTVGDSKATFTISSLVPKADLQDAVDAYKTYSSPSIYADANSCCIRKS